MVNSISYDWVQPTANPSADVIRFMLPALKRYYPIKAVGYSWDDHLKMAEKVNGVFSFDECLELSQYM